MALVLPTKEPKPYKEIFKARGVKQWQLCKIFGVREPVLSRWLNGIHKMLEDVDQAMTLLAAQLEAGGLPRGLTETDGSVEQWSVSI